MTINHYDIALMPLSHNVIIVLPNF